MGEITAVPLMALIMAVWAFLKFPPARGTPKDHNVFNALVLGLGAMLWGIWYYQTARGLKSISLVKYKYLLGIGGGAAALLVYLGVFFLVRNFWIFKDNSNRPGRWF